MERVYGNFKKKKKSVRNIMVFVNIVNFLHAIGYAPICYIIIICTKAL